MVFQIFSPWIMYLLDIFPYGFSKGTAYGSSNVSIKNQCWFYSTCIRLGLFVGNKKNDQLASCITLWRVIIIHDERERMHIHFNMLAHARARRVHSYASRATSTTRTRECNDVVVVVVVEWKGKKKPVPTAFPDVFVRYRSLLARAPARGPPSSRFVCVHASSCIFLPRS